MLRIQSNLPFVKRQLDYQTRQRDRLHEKIQRKAAAGGDVGPDVHKATLHERIVLELQSLIDSMIHDIEQAGQEAPSNRVTPDDPLFALLESPTALTPDQLRDLPQDLIDQLQISESDKFQWGVVDLISRSYGQTMSIEVLLIALYRTTGKIYERVDLSNRLYRLTRKGVLYTVQGRKGFYTTRADNSGVPEFDYEEAEVNS